MAQIVYYTRGRGIVDLPSTTAEAVTDSMSTAMLLIFQEALEHNHEIVTWQLGRHTSCTQCPTCGHSAVITKIARGLVVDSCLHTSCCAGVSAHS